MSKIKMIKADAQVQISIGTAFLQRLQQVMVFVGKDLTDEQLKELEEGVKAGVTNFDEPAIQHTVTLLSLISEIEKEVINNNMYTERDEVTPLEN